MSFSDLPIVDNSSINSELSAIELISKLNQASGFICREDVPDKGCDFDVELIINNTEASNWRFALQLKSILHPNYIDEGNYISYSFETSRLGYLTRRQPAFGIIVLYSVQDKRLYFDYVDCIYDRLVKERDNDDWKKNDKVNIKIPTSSYLNEDTIKNLHSTFVRRFENAQLMQITHGEKYDLPIINSDSSLNNEESIIEKLKKYGISLLRSYNLGIVHKMISSLSMAQINTDKELQAIAAITYCEAGQHIEAAYYFHKISKINYTEIDETIEFAKLKNDFSLGNIDIDELIEKMTSLRNDVTNSINSITIDINLVQFELMKLSRDRGKKTDTLLITTKELFNDIDTASMQDHYKAQLSLWNLYNYSYLISIIRIRAISELKIALSLNVELSLEEKREKILYLASYEDDFSKKIMNVYDIVKKLENDSLTATIILLNNRHVLFSKIDTLPFKKTTSSIIDNDDENLLIDNIDKALYAYNVFIENSRYKEAYRSICDAIDFAFILLNFYCIDKDLRIDRMIDEKIKLENDFDLPVYKSPIPELINRTKKQANEKNSPSNYKDFTDEDIEYLSSTILSLYKLPEDRRINIVNEIKSYRLFHSRCTNPSLELLVNHPSTYNKHSYSEPVEFIIKSIITGIQTPPSSDMEKLLGYWSL